MSAVDPTKAKPYTTIPGDPGCGREVTREGLSFPIVSRELDARAIATLLNDAYQAGARDMKTHLHPSHMPVADPDGRYRGPVMSWDSLKPEDQAYIRVRYNLSTDDCAELSWRYVWGGGKPGYWEAVS